MGNVEVRQTVFGSGNIFTGSGDIRINYQLPPAEARDRRVLLQLTDSVKNFWIEGVLQRSVHEAVMLELSKEARPDAVQHPWERVLELPGQQARSLAGAQSIADIFSETGRALLLLGEPGAGKTVSLLELARDLISRFEKNPKEAAPVVLNLSTWEKKRGTGTFGVWLEAELKTKYFVPPRRSRAWLAANRLILLLDGLDEVAPVSQPACIQAINHFLENTGAPGIAVCSRLGDYLALSERLRFTGAVCLRPLTAGQIDGFLERGGEQVAALRMMLQKDVVLQELAQSPLLLNVLSLAYRGLPVEAIAEQRGETIETRRHQLFGCYVQRMFRRVPNAPAAYPDTRTRGWLNWLACRMRDHSLTIFSLDQLQPSWLPSARDRWIYAFASRIMCATVWGFVVWSWWMIVPLQRPLFLRGVGFVIIAGITAGGLAGFFDALRLARPANTRSKWVECFRVIGLVALHAVGLGTVFGVMSAVFFDPVDPVLLQKLGYASNMTGWRADAQFGFGSGLNFGLMFALRSLRISAKHDIRLVEALRLSWASARKGARICAIPASVIAVVLVAVVAAVQWKQNQHQPVFVQVIALILAVAIITLFFAAIGAVFGMFVTSDLPKGVRPGQWLRRSVQNAVMAGFAIAVAALILSSPWKFFAVPPSSLPQLFLTSGALGIAGAMWFGGFDALQHLMLRFMLRRRGLLPKNTIRFLDYAARLIFLQKVGAGYIFVHRQLLEYFAAAPEDGTQFSKPG